MIYEKKNIKRLLKLADHLKEGKLHRDFVPMTPPVGRSLDQPPVFQTEEGIEFAYFTFIPDSLPYLFPEHWAFRSDRTYLTRCPDLPEHEACASFFGLSPKEFLHLSTPNAQNRQWGGKTLGYDATPWDVSDNILALVTMHSQMN